jgi:hypothetical protein
MRTCHRHYPGRLNGACSLICLHCQRPSPCNSKVGSCNCFFEACSAFTHVWPARSRSRQATLSIESSDSFEDLWLDAATVAQNDRTAITAVYLNSLNETIDLHEKRVAAFENRIPQPVWLLIISVSLIAVFTRGSTLTARFWLTLILVPITIAIVVGLIADLDAPSRGLIRLDQRAMQRLKADISTDAAHPDRGPHRCD